MSSPQPLHRRGGRGGTYVYDATAIAWRVAGKEGIALRSVRHDDSRGEFLGMVGFEPMTRSGLHQHQDVATSFFVDGSLTDYQGSIGLHEMGINLAGATHDAIAYQRTLLVARLEGPVTYPADAGPLHGLHAGARHDTVENRHPEVPPDINVKVDALGARATGIAGIVRRDVFDYAPVAGRHRLAQLSLAPGARLPRLETTDLVEFWVRAGEIALDGARAQAGCFVIAEPGAALSLSAPFGALLIAWAQAPTRWLDACPADEPFGFG